MTREGSRGGWLAIMMGVFAVLWVFWGTLSLPDLIEICVVGGALVISVVVGLVASRWVRNIPAERGGQPPSWKIFWGWVVFEVIAGVVGVNLLYQLGQGRFALPWLGLVVGIHFFGMGAAFHTPIHHWVGTAMCLLALISLIWLPSGRAPSAGVVKVSDLVVGIGCAVILWSSFWSVPELGPAGSAAVARDASLSRRHEPYSCVGQVAPQIAYTPS